MSAHAETLDSYTIQSLPKLERGAKHLYTAISTIATEIRDWVKDTMRSFQPKEASPANHDAHDAHGGGHGDHGGGHGHEADFGSEMRSGLSDVITTPFTAIGDIWRLGRQAIKKVFAH
jgi:hypothetical protein